jgi:zinc/manganese transport system substrate-binding protein
VTRSSQCKPRFLQLTVLMALALALVTLIPALMVTAPASAASATSRPHLIQAVGAENEYANVLSQIGGRYVHVSAILTNPNTDPHAFEASPSVAREVSAATLVVQNGVGYDTFMTNIESASPNKARKVIVAQHVLGLPNSTSNPHLWYNPKTMPAVAKVMATDLSQADPAEAAYFSARLKVFDVSLLPWLSAIASFKKAYAGTPVAVTEPVADYMLQAMGMKILTPFTFQADIMNGVDPSPEGVAEENGFFTKHQVKVFCYNQQVVDALTSSIKQTAQSAGVPLVGVYETMPTPGYDYQTWMEAEVAAIEAAVVQKRSTEKL